MLTSLASALVLGTTPAGTDTFIDAFFRDRFDATADPPSGTGARGGYCGGVFDGRYVYLAPYGNCEGFPSWLVAGRDAEYVIASTYDG